MRTGGRERERKGERDSEKGKQNADGPERRRETQDETSDVALHRQLVLDTFS